MYIFFWYYLSYYLLSNEISRSDVQEVMFVSFIAAVSVSYPDEANNGNDARMSLIFTFIITDQSWF
jgi:hypothetical protein